MFELTAPSIRVQNLRWLALTEVCVVGSIKLFSAISMSELRFASNHMHMEQIIQKACNTYALSVLPRFQLQK